MDHGFSGPAHEVSYPRQMFVCSTAPGQGCTAAAAEAAASLAATALVMHRHGLEYGFTDPQPAALIERARTYLKFAETMGNDDGYNIKANPFYTSNSFQDELGWASIWLYQATGESQYLTKALEYTSTTPGWGFSWDEKTAGAQILIADALRQRIEAGETQYQDTLATLEQTIHQYLVGSWMGDALSRTPDGLTWLIEWGSLRYSMNTAFLAAVYASRLEDVELRTSLVNFASSQVAYALGNNARRGSYVVGHGANSPQEPHHRSAAGSAETFDSPAGTRPFKYTLVGALVGGPVTTDASAWEDNSYWTDDRADYIANEVATDYNAGFTGVVAKLIELR